MKMTVYFDSAFWAALVEFRDSQNRYKAFSYVFGKEPKNEDILYFLHHDLGKWLSRYDKIEISSSVEASAIAQKKTNPKKMQRELNRAKRKPVISTKAQDAMKELQERLKQERKTQSKEKREAEKVFKYQQKQQKRHQKKKGH